MGFGLTMRIFSLVTLFMVYICDYLLYFGNFGSLFGSSFFFKYTNVYFVVILNDMLCSISNSHCYD